jgi:hypothetical protein
MGLIKFNAPSLPIPTTTYSQDQQQQRDNSLRLYFNQIDFAYWDGIKVVNSYGAWKSLVTQTATANTATAVALEVVDYENSTSIASSSRMTVAYPGIYNLQWSAQILNSDILARSLSVWLKKNGTDVIGSTRNTLVQAGQANGAWSYYIQLSAADYIEIYWSTNNALVTLQTYAAQTTPTRPTTPSVIATLSFVSAIP